MENTISSMFNTYVLFIDGLHLGDNFHFICGKMCLMLMIYIHENLKETLVLLFFGFMLIFIIIPFG